MFKQKELVAAVAVTLGTLGMVGAASAATTFTFANTAAVGGGTTAGLADGATNNLSGFSAGNEFHVATAGGAKNDGHKDIIIGDGSESWTFNGAGDLSGVAGFGTANSGAANSAPITSGVAGFPIAAAGTHGLMFQNAPFFAQNFSILANTTTSVAGVLYGAATVTEIDAGSLNGTDGTFEVFVPTMNIQWANGGYIIGGSDGTAAQCTAGGCPGPGITFRGETSGANFNLFASRVMSLNEVTVAGFATNSVEFALAGTFATTTTVVPVPAAAWLFGSGLMGMVGVARRRRNKV